VDLQNNDAPAWYCVRTKPKNEHLAAAGLTKNLGIEVYYPRLRIERLTQRGMVRVVEPLFPGYLFAHCALNYSIDAVRHVAGVSSLVHFGRGIPVIEESVIEELKESFQHEESVQAADPLQPGSEVRIGSGAFLGLSGMVVRLMPAKQRVQILLDLLGRSTVAEVDRASLIIENRRLVDMVPFLALANREVAGASC
jgi:transcriptional antiterminator RfaH